MDPMKMAIATKDWMRRLAKGVVLIIWIAVLVSLAGLAASGRASQEVVNFFKPNNFSFYWSSQTTVLSPSDILARYLRGRENPPPIEAVLDEILVHPSWSERHLRRSTASSAVNVPQPSSAAASRAAQEARADTNRWLTDQYDSLFRRVDSLLQSLVRDTSVDVDGLSVVRPAIPERFLGVEQEKIATPLPDKIVLPRAAVSWIKDQRIRNEKEKERNSLIDTFFLLIVLGAFGSLIFLTKDYIEREQHTLLAAYIFRPVLGMFLAVAVFIVDIVAHSVVSTASILQTRHETLFILALAAGMLSEQAYEVVSIRAKTALEEWRKEREPADTSSGGAATGATSGTEPPATP